MGHGDVHGRAKQLPGSVEVVEDLEPVEPARRTVSAARSRRTVAETRSTHQEAQDRMDARLARLHQERATGARRDLKRWAHGDH